MCLQKISLFFLMVMLLWTQMLFAQYKKRTDSAGYLKSLFKIKIGLQSGPEWEQKIGPLSVLSFSAGVTVARQSDNLYSTKAPLILLPSSYAEYRNYFNFNMRREKEKKIRDNSADFLFAKVETFYAIKNQNYFGLLFIQGWGLQRSITKKLSADCHLGIIEHVYYDKPPYGGYHFIKVEPDVELTVSYILN